jgi:hypothetical protein
VSAALRAIHTLGEIAADDRDDGRRAFVQSLLEYVSGHQPPWTASDWRRSQKIWIRYVSAFVSDASGPHSLDIAEQKAIETMQLGIIRQSLERQ